MAVSGRLCQVVIRTLATGEEEVLVTVAGSADERAAEGKGWGRHLARARVERANVRRHGRRQAKRCP